MRDFDREQELLRQAVQPTLTLQSVLVARAPALGPVFKVLNENLFDTDYDSAALAEETGWRVDELRSTFEREVLLALEKYLFEERLGTAARLLVDTDLTVEVIAEIVGYLETRSFRRAFGTWSGGLSPRDFRDTVRELIARIGPLPADGLSWSYMERVVRGDLIAEESDFLVDFLLRLYESSGPSSPSEPQVVDRVAVEVSKAIEELPWPEQKEMVREALLVTPYFFDYLSEQARETGRHNRQRAVQLAELAIENLLAMETKVDFERLVLAWARLAHQRLMLGDVRAAEAAFEASATQSHYILPKPDDRDRKIAGERWYLEARLRWYQRRFDEARALLDQAVKALPEGTLLARALLLRAGLESHVPAGESQGLDDLRAARELLDETTHPDELLELNDLWLEAHARRGDGAAVLDALPAARELGARLGHAETRCRCLWHEGFAAGERGEAEAGWREARAGFVALRLPERSAPVVLELAALCLEQGRGAEALDWSRQLLATLEGLDLHRDALPGRKALRRAVDTGELTAEAVDEARGAVRVVEREYKARRGPYFEL